MPPARHHAAGEAALVLGFLAGVEPHGFGVDRSDLVPVGKPLRQHGPRVYAGDSVR
jgi:hypothetical protein